MRVCVHTQGYQGRTLLDVVLLSQHVLHVFAVETTTTSDVRSLQLELSVVLLKCHSATVRAAPQSSVFLDVRIWQCVKPLLCYSRDVKDIIVSD